MILTDPCIWELIHSIFNIQREDIKSEFEIITIPLKSNPSYKLPVGKTAYHTYAIYSLKEFS